MAMGRQGARRDQKMMVLWDELPRSRGHAFYDRLQRVLREAGFDRRAAGRHHQLLANSSGGSDSDPLVPYGACAGGYISRDGTSP